MRGHEWQPDARRRNYKRNYLITCARQWARRLVPSSLSAVLICSAMPSCSTNRCTSVRLPKAASSFVGTCWGEGDQHAISGNQLAIRGNQHAID